MLNRPHLKGHVLATITFLGFAGLTFDRLWLNFTTALPNNGQSTDYAIFYWDFWWMKQALVNLQVNPFKTNYILYPHGGSLALHTFVPFFSFISIPFQYIFSLVTIFNLFVIGSFWLTAYLTYLFLRRKKVQVSLAILGGAMVAFMPALQARAMESHLNMLPMFWIPLVLILFDLLVEKKRWHIAVWLTVATYAALLTDLQYLMWIASVLIPYSLYQLVNLDSAHRVQVIKLIGLSLILFAPLVYLYPIRPILELRLVDFPQASADTASAYSYPLTTFISRGDYYFSFGQLPILLMIIAMLVGGVWSGRSIWLLIGFINLIAAFGPYLDLNEQVRIPLPYAVIHRLLDGFYRVPGRFAVLTGFAFAIFICLTAQNLIQRYKVKPRTVNLIGILICGAMIWDFDLLSSFPTVTLPEYETYRLIGEDELAQTLLEVPLGVDVGYARYGRGHELIYYQPVHEKQILTGALSRAPYQAVQNYRNIDFLEAVAGKGSLTPTAGQQLTQLINDWHIDYLTIHLDKLTPEMRQMLLPFFASHPDICYWRTEGELLAYQARQIEGCQMATSADIQLGTPADLQYVGAGWFPAENIGGVQGRWSSDGLLHLNLEPQSYILEFRALAFPENQAVSVFVNDVLIETVPLINDWQTYRVTVPATVFEDYGWATFQFQHETLQSAFDRTNGESPDQRPLGAAYDRVSIFPTQ